MVVVISLPVNGKDNSSLTAWFLGRSVVLTFAYGKQAVLSSGAGLATF